MPALSPHAMSLMYSASGPRCGSTVAVAAGEKAAVPTAGGELVSMGARGARAESCRPESASM
eukprot:2245519-Prymnesium_polylepis.1